MDHATYLTLQRLAMRLSRRADEADDLLHDALVAGLEAGRGDAAWLSGVLRNQAALTARGAGRRRRREQLVAADLEVTQAAPTAPLAADPRPLLRRLPPAARRLAVLVLHGLDGEEIRWILGISPTAFRQRLSRIRRALALLSSEQRETVIAASPLRGPDAVEGSLRQLGLLRRALQQAMQQSGDGLGTHDGDGHLLIIRRRAHTSAPGGNEIAGLPRNEE
jgi:DNA-directed RNA polymerase specialized sigma24 family protein